MAVITYGLFITQKMLGQVKSIALWDAVFKCALLHKACLKDIPRIQKICLQCIVHCGI